MKENDMPLRLSITYITERIIAMIFPSENQETTYKSNLAEVSQVVKNKHGDNYLMINLSERRNDMHKLHKQVIDFGWPEVLAPPLERLCNICKSMDSWLNKSVKNVVVIHCKGGLGRLAVVLSAYIDYSNICASDEQSLDQCAMRHFFENKLNGTIHPSQKRYVHYFAGLLSGAININNNSLFLHQIVIRGIPDFDGKGGCCPYIKIYQGMKPVYVSGVFSSTSSSNQIIVTLEPCLQLRSDVLVKCYNKSDSSSQFGSSSGREIIFRCQFHTCAISNNILKFGKTDLDEAWHDPRFPSHGQVEFVLSDTTYNWNKYECQPSERNILIGTSPESIQRWNSYENFAGPVEDVSFEDVSSFEAERRELYDQNHTSRSYREVNSLWKPNVDSSSFLKKSTASEKWNTDNVGRKFNEIGMDSSEGHPSAFNSTNHSRMKSHSREMLSDEQSQAIFSTLPSQSNAEQQQLDDILKELLEEPLMRSSSSALVCRDEHAPPSHGVITTEGDKMKTTLSWNASQAGATRSATVTRQTVAAPAPRSKLASEVTRYREVTGDEDHIVGGKMTSSENYSCQMPGFQEKRKVETLSESRIEDRTGTFNAFQQKHLPFSDSNSYQSLRRQRSLNDKNYKTYSGRNYASDSEDQIAWLENQRNKLRTMKENKSWKNKSMQEKQLLAELKSAQGAYYKSKRAQSDTEDLDHNYRQSHNKSDFKIMPLSIQEFRDSKGRRCQTIETETYSKRCETTANQFAGSQSNTGAALSNISPQKQLMPPPRSSTPSTPVIPDRGESSREAYLRNQYALKPLTDYNFDSDARNHGSLSRPNLTQIEPPQPVEVEIVSLQPIGPGVQALEPGSSGPGTILRTPALTYPNHGTPTRDYTMSSSISVPTALSNLQPSSAQLKPPINNAQSFSRTDFQSVQQQAPLVPNFQQQASLVPNFQQQAPLVPNFQQQAPLVPNFQQQTLQKSFTSESARTDGRHTLPHSFTPQPIVQTFKETQTWSTTNTPQPATLQHFPAQIGGSVQHLNQQQTIQRSMNASTDGRSVPILVQQQERSVAPVGQNPPSVYQGQTREASQQQGFMQQQQIIRQQFVQPPPVGQDTTMGTMRSASSQNHLLVETHSPHLVGSSGNRYRSLSSGGGGGYFHHQSNSTARTRADSFSSAAGEAYEFINQTPKFIRDVSKLWHRPNFTREEAIQYLKDKPPGSFVIRNSSTYPGSYGLTLRVAQIPSNVPLSGGDPQLDLVRHFILEPTPKGVQLKGSAHEPPFASLAAFVYQHSITPLSLPCKLLMPDSDGFEVSEFSSNIGSPPVSPSASCNVLYIGSLDTESLTGPEALSRALDKIFNGSSGLPKTHEVSFKASSQGITITDNKRRTFFRRHYALNTITYLGLDNQELKWAVADFDGQPIPSGRVFGFVARKQGNATDNSCHLFAELEASQQSAQTLINFITQIMVDQGRTVTTTST